MRGEKAPRCHREAAESHTNHFGSSRKGKASPDPRRLGRESQTVGGRPSALRAWRAPYTVYLAKSFLSNTTCVTK